MDYISRVKFRKSRRWKSFRHKMRMNCNVDYITHEPLEVDANLHHMDLNVERYDNMNPDNFVFLNRSTHTLIHDLYKLYFKDKKSIDRIKEMLEKMYVLSSS